MRYEAEERMQTRKLGWTDLNLTTMGLGTWAMGGSGWKFSWGPQSDGDSIESIVQAVGQGINWIDTAPVYGLGHSEEVVGQALSQMTSHPIIATKCGRVWDTAGEIDSRLTRASIRAEAENSLRRLRIETIDLYQIHWPAPDHDIEEAWNTVADLIKEGKVRYGGVSNFSVAQLQRIQPIHPVASLQPPYSMLERSIEADLMQYCAQNRIGIIVYSPMVKGLLSGKMTRERIASLPADDHRRNDPRFQEPQLSANLDLVQQLKAIAERHGKTVLQLALAWTLRRPEITAAIVGTRAPSQLRETITAGEWMLGMPEIDAIEDLLQQRRERLRSGTAPVT